MPPEKQFFHRQPLLKSIATVSLSGTLPEKLEAAVVAGFGGVEILESDLLAFDGSPAEVRRIAEGLGLATCGAGSMPGGLSSRLPTRRSA